MLTGNTTYQVAHIYPYSLPDQSSAKEFKFWDILEGFWSEERIQRWREKIFPDQNCPDQGSETCQNLICLSHDAHAYWGRAYFALKPIQLSDDEKTLDVEFHWLPQRGYSAGVDVTTSPTSSKVSDISAGTKLFHFPTEQAIHSGRKISLTTDDPVKRPLPSFGLLEMQWILHRLVAMSGAAEIDDDFDNDDDDAMALRDEWLQHQADEWHSSHADGRHPYQDDESDSSSEDDDGHSSETSPKAHRFSPPSSQLRQPSPTRLPKSNTRSDYIPPRAAENAGIKIIGSSQGQ